MRHIISLGIASKAHDGYLWYRREVDDLIPAGCGAIFVGGPFGTRQILERTYHPGTVEGPGTVVHSLGTYSEMNASFRSTAISPEDLAAMVAHLISHGYKRTG